MSALSYLMPIIVIGGIVAYYLLIYRKGKQAGGGMMAGFAERAHEKWGDTLDSGERIHTWGVGITVLPAWKAFLVENFPICKLIWKVPVYLIVATDQRRLLMAEQNSLGSLRNKRAYPLSEVAIESSAEQKQGLAMKLNPIARAYSHKTFELRFAAGSDNYHIAGASGDLINAMQGHVPAQAAAAAPAPVA